MGNRTIVIKLEEVDSPICVDNVISKDFVQVNNFTELQREIIKNKYECILIFSTKKSSKLIEPCHDIINLNLPIAIVIVSHDTTNKHKLLELGVTKVINFSYLKKNSISETIDLAIIREARTRRLLKKINEQEYNSTHDAVTGLSNRAFFYERLNHSIILGQYYYQQFALLMCDIDHFTSINETLGSIGGDKLLKEFSLRLMKSLPLDAIVARIYGDQFSIILPNIETSDMARQAADKILDSVRLPFIIDNYEQYITVSIGISVYPSDGSNADTLIKACVAATKKVKELGRNHYRYFASSMNSQAIKQYTLSNQIRQAWQNEEFTLFYQPKVDTLKNKVTGVEALIRWSHPQMGLVSPSEFMSIIEDTGQVDIMGDWVIETAMEQHCIWKKSDIGELSVAINMSATQFYSSNFITKLEFNLQKYEMNPRYLVIELTEQALMKEHEMVTNALNSVRRLGVSVSLDDFGTGYSSLSHLRDFPINSLKVDKSFIMGMVNSQADLGIVDAVITLGHSLGKDVICEGVETHYQYERLLELGCNHMQGFYFARPSTAENIAKFIRKFEGR